MVTIPKSLHQFSKYATIGVLNTAIDIGLLNLLIYWHWDVILANTVAFIVAATNSYFFNKHWTYEDKEGKWQTQLPLFLIVGGVGLGLSDLFVYEGSLILHWNVNVVKIVSIVAIVAWNFFAPKLLIFKK